MPGRSPGHPRISGQASKTWMAGTSPAMTRDIVDFNIPTSIHEGVVHEDDVLALGAGREQRHRRADQLLEPAHIFDALRRELGPGAGTARRLRPAFHGLIDRLDTRLRPLRRRQM